MVLPAGNIQHTYTPVGLSWYVQMDLPCSQNSVSRSAVYFLVHCWSEEGPEQIQRLADCWKRLYTGNSVFEESTTTALLKSVCMQETSNTDKRQHDGWSRYSHQILLMCVEVSIFILLMLKIVWPPTQPQQHKVTMTQRTSEIFELSVIY